MRVLVIFTGGTIGCSPPDSNAVLSTTVQKRAGNGWKDYYLLTSFMEKSESEYKGEVTFDVMEPLNTLSENMTVSKWSVLLKALQNIDFSLYNGIIITHGTDTLAYTAPFLGILLSGVSLPVVLVSANRNLHDPATNGHQNFNAALDFICKANYAGVYVAYSYDMQKTIIYMGTRIKQSHAYIDRYESTDGIDFGFVENGNFTKTCNITPIPYDGKNILRELTKINSPAAVMLVQPYVGLDYSLIPLDKSKIQAVLHTVYHSFTACTDDTDGDFSSILHFSKRCDENGILLYIAPFSETILNGGERYESTNAMLNPKGNMNFLFGHSVECAYAKLLIAVNLYTDARQIKEFLAQSYSCENV